MQKTESQEIDKTDAENSVIGEYEHMIWLFLSSRQPASPGPNRGRRLSTTNDKDNNNHDYYYSSDNDYCYYCYYYCYYDCYYYGYYL